MKEEVTSKKEDSSPNTSSSHIPTTPRGSSSTSDSKHKSSKDKKKEKEEKEKEKPTFESENVHEQKSGEISNLNNGTPAKPKKPRHKIWGRNKKEDINDLKDWNLSPDELKEISSSSSTNPKKLKHRSSFEKREKKIHSDIEEKEKELDVAYQEIKRLIDSLVNSIHDSQPKGDVVDISNAIGVLVAKTGDIKRDLCDMYEKEQDFHSVPISDNEEDDDADSIDAESFAFYELNHIKIHSSKSDGSHMHHHTESNSVNHNNNNSSSSSTTSKAIRKEGFLSKKNGLRNKWSLRLFVLENHELKWFDKESLLKTPRKPKGRYDLWKSSVLLKLDDQSNESSTRFYIQSGGKTMNLQAKNEDEKKQWIDSILQSIESAVAIHGYSSPTQQKHSSKS